MCPAHSPLPLPAPFSPRPYRLLAIDAPLGFTVTSLSFSGNLASLSLSRILIYVQPGKGAEDLVSVFGIFSENAHYIENIYIYIYLV